MSAQCAYPPSAHGDSGTWGSPCRVFSEHLRATGGLGWTQSTFFKDHWVTIEPEKLAYFDSFFDLPEPVMEMLLAPLALTGGDVAIDLGCGPGYLTAAMARLVGENGHVYGLDVNGEFLARAVGNAEARGVGEVCSFQVAEDDLLPFGGATIDALFAKNVFEYVPDVGRSLGEAHRVLRSGGRMTAICSDYGFYVAEPLAPTEVRELLQTPNTRCP